MKEVLYKKQGRRYVPIAEYDKEYLDSFPKGAHLVICHPGGQSRRFNVDPALAPMIAAGRYAEDVVTKALVKAAELRPKRALLTKEQQEAWQKLIGVLGEDARYLEWASARDVAEAGTRAMIDEAEKLLDNPAVRKAYDRFLMIAELVKKREPAE
jgi:hypothetical protein